MIDYSNPPEGLFVYPSHAHFEDLDSLGVMHHSRYILHLERAQQALFDRLMQTEAFDPQRYPDVYVVVRRLEIDYLRPIDNVMDFLVTLRVDRLREAGLNTRFEFRSTDGGTLFAKGIRVICRLSTESHRPTGFSPQFREVYSKWEALAKTLPS